MGSNGENPAASVVGRVEIILHADGHWNSTFEGDFHAILIALAAVAEQVRHHHLTAHLQEIAANERQSL